MVTIPFGEPDSHFNFDILLIEDVMIIKYCIVATMSNEFTFGHDAIDSLMLFKPAVVITQSGDANIVICSECKSSLLSKKMLCFALANKLYCGAIPAQFADLSWVEELVCAIYRTTAQVTCLFSSTDPTLPNVLHSNTCCHDTDVASTASILPRTPSDIVDGLSIVFIGPGKMHHRFLKNMFRICKGLTCAWLKWLSHHNALYHDMAIDFSIFDKYADDDFPRGLEQNIIYDSLSNVKDIFAEETADFSDHPASTLSGPASDPDQPFIFVEKMGVSDPEGVKISGCTFMASALRNLIFEKTDSTLPDLVLHHGFSAIPEYNNPKLIPGMFVLYIHMV